jgi:translation initiation factor 1
VGRKEDRIGNELQGGELSHNPFASLLGGKAPSAPRTSQQPKGSISAAPQPNDPGQKLIVRFEAKGHGGKTVTRITGLGLGEEPLKALARQLKKSMGTGARVADGDVLVQGKLVERLATWLEKNGHGHVIRGN